MIRVFAGIGQSTRTCPPPETVIADDRGVQGVTVTGCAGDQSGPVWVPFLRIRDRKK